LSEDLDEARTILDEISWRFDHKTKELEAKVTTETERNTKLHEDFENLRNKCADFATRCVNQLKGIFNSVGAASEECSPSAKDIPGAFDHIENEVEALDEVITGHGDFYALLALHGTAAAFMKAGCTHAKTVNKPNFNLSTPDLVDIPAKARSIGNRFITKIWAKAGLNLLGTKHENYLTRYETFTYLLYLGFPLLYFLISSYLLCFAGWSRQRPLSQSLLRRTEDS
jgi:hypothetical protein